MDEKNKRIEELLMRLEQLSRMHKRMNEEIDRLRSELVAVRTQGITEIKSAPEVNSPEPAPETAFPPLPKPAPMQKAENVAALTSSEPNPVAGSGDKNALEVFIGTNLLNKVGIAILVVGIGFGAKYAIDHQLLQPLTRIILGYIGGVMLLGFAYWLKPTYKSFSAVLLSGGMAVLYFITYAAYDLYDLIPQAIAFVLMVLFTAFTVAAALHYGLQVIAVIGLVGAYGVPFLLSDGSGRAEILFSYMAVINVGIVVIAFRKKWAVVNYLAFGLTWLIVASWYFVDSHQNHTLNALVFTTVFFLIFEISFLAYKILKTEKLDAADIAITLLNSFIYFGLGYDAMNTEDMSDYLGLFTAFIALVHFGSAILAKRKSAASETFYFVAGLVLVFLTIAVPVQLDGNWVTLVWAAEASLLFWIGRTKSLPVYEKLSYPLIAISFLSLLQDWTINYADAYIVSEPLAKTHTLFLNISFFTSVFVCLVYGFVNWLDRKGQFARAYQPGSALSNAIAVGVPALFLFVAYASIFKEIQFYWNLKYAASAQEVFEEGTTSTVRNLDMQHFKVVWLLIYSSLFVTTLAVIQHLKIRTRLLAAVCIGGATLTLLVFILAGLFSLSQLGASYLAQPDSFHHGVFNIVARYIVLLAMVPMLFINYLIVKQHFDGSLHITERIVCHAFTLIILSDLLLHWIELANIRDQNAFSLSIFWGCYALYLIVVGLKKDLAHLRVIAIIVFGVTVLKLFFYDMAGMSTISKTVVMIVLGVLLLVASFLYNKFKSARTNE
ncbi:MAG: DUF2339 domain-containing protein [Bacteroidia bacterium]|nr:DUF2339 domain-containing protein [Bacteroidia bacterium]